MTSPISRGRRWSHASLELGATDDPDLVFVEALDVPCPCGGRVRVGTLDDQMAALHSLPYCADFEQLDLISFLRWLRDHSSPTVGRRAPHLFIKENRP